MLHFFTSYARGEPQDDTDVLGFFEDLSTDVRHLAGVRKGVPVGFIDQIGLPVGSRWPPKLVTALATCRVFLAMGCPLYFRSTSCGREWGYFSRRLDAHVTRPGKPAPALIPLIWVRTEAPLPEIARQYQYSDHDFGEAYAKHGLRQLLRLERNRDDYVAFVWALANRIMAADEPPQVPEPQRPAFTQIPAAFGDADAGLNGVHTTFGGASFAFGGLHATFGGAGATVGGAHATFGGAGATVGGPDSALGEADSALGAADPTRLSGWTDGGHASERGRPDWAEKDRIINGGHRPIPNINHSPAPTRIGETVKISRASTRREAAP